MDVSHDILGAKGGPPVAGSPFVEGMLLFEQDPRTGVFQVRAEGFWSSTQVDEHFTRLAKAITAHRQRGAPVRAFVDLSRAAVQTPDVASRVHAATTAIYRRGDRVAVLLGSILARAQMRRVLDREICETFTSRAAGEAWLDARG